MSSREKDSPKRGKVAGKQQSRKSASVKSMTANSPTASAALNHRTGQPFGSLGSNDLLQLQQTVGNHFVDRHLTATKERQRIAIERPSSSGHIVQRVIAAPNLTPSADATEQARLQALSLSATQYNALDQVSAAEADLQARFSHITQLERLIYAWYGAKQALDLTDNTDATLGGNATEMRAFLRNTEAERDAVVTAIRAGGHAITFDGANPADLANLRTLWTAVVNQTGNLRAIGSAPELDRLFSRIAAALQTPTGRQILDYMVNRSPQVVTMLFSSQLNLQQLAAASGASAPDQANLLSNQDTSFAGQADLGLDSALVKDTTGQPATALTTPAAFISDVTGPNPSARYSANGVAYRPGASRGAFAAVKDAPALDANRQKASSAAGNEVLTPTFVTLMHELGHALKMASGVYMPSQTFHPELTSHFLPDTHATDNWPASGLEENMNVLGVENPIRQESQISSRDSYETPEKVRMIQARQAAEQAWINLRANDNPDAFVYLDEALKRCDRQTVAAFRAINIFDAQTAADVAARIAPIQNLLQPANQLVHKRAFIIGEQTRFNNFMAGLSVADRNHIQRTQRYQNLNQRFTNLIVNNLVALGQTQCNVQAQVDKFIQDRALLISAGKKIRHVGRYGLWSPANWGPGGRQADEGTA